MSQHATARLSDRDYANLIQLAQDNGMDVDEQAGELIKKQLETEVYA